jgi:uncharacterized protein
MTSEFTFLSGALMGFASSLHCAGICGGIASSFLLAASAGSPSAPGRAAALVGAQLGRAMTYMVCGALVGGVGAGFGILTELAGVQGVVRILSALSLAWVGLSVAGIGPGLAQLDRILAPGFRALASVLPKSMKITSPLAFGLACGLTWGLTPCGMVYAALLNAMLSGSAAAGASFMAGFGLATVPAVAAAAYGATALVGFGRGAEQKSRLRTAIGVAILLLGLASLAVPVAAGLTALCLQR